MIENWINDSEARFAIDRIRSWVRKGYIGQKQIIEGSVVNGLRGKRRDSESDQI